MMHQEERKEGIPISGMKKRDLRVHIHSFLGQPQKHTPPHLEQVSQVICIISAKLLMQVFQHFPMRWH